MFSTPKRYVGWGDRVSKEMLTVKKKKSSLIFIQWQEQRKNNAKFVFVR